MISKTRNKILLISFLVVILLASLLVRTIPVRTDYHFWDETVYLQNAEVLIGEQPADHYHEWDLRPPLFPLFLGLVMLFTKSLLVMHILVSLIATSVIFFTFLLGRELYDAWTGVLAAAFMGLSYTHLILSHNLLVDPILPIFWILTTYYFVRALKTGKKKHHILTGVMTGLAILMKFTSLMIAIIIPILMIVQQLFDVKKRKKENSILYICKAIKHTVKGFFFRRWTLATILTLTPYFIWNTTAYGNPLHSIMTGLSLSGGKDPFWRYVINSTELLPVIALLGLVLFLPQLKRFKETNIHVPIIVILSLVLPLQFLIANKELRFMLAILPLLAIIGARGYTAIRLQNKYYTYVISGIIILGLILSALALPPEEPHIKEQYLEQFKEGHFTTTGWHPPVEEASKWLRNNTEENTVIYTNYRWPEIAYYSKQRIIITSIHNKEDNLTSQFTQKGYVVYSPNSPANSSEHLLAIIKNNSDFTKAKRFGDMTIFFYTPENSTEALFER
ncbi:MAG: ArnT family glycosyltransferase [Nanobdellota archaeon]